MLRWYTLGQPNTFHSWAFLQSIPNGIVFFLFSFGVEMNACVCAVYGGV